MIAFRACRVGAAGCGLGDRGTRAHIGHCRRAPTGITPDGGLSYGVRAADRAASCHHRVGCLHLQRHRRPGTDVGAAGADGLIPVAHAAAITVSSTQSSGSGRSSPASILSARSPIRRMPATCMSHFYRRRRQPGTGSCIVLPVDTAPCTSASIRLARSRSRPNACSPDSLCLVRRDGVKTRSGGG